MQGPSRHISEHIMEILSLLSKTCKEPQQIERFVKPLWGIVECHEENISRLIASPVFFKYGLKSFNKGWIMGLFATARELVGMLGDSEIPNNTVIARMFAAQCDSSIKDISIRNDANEVRYEALRKQVLKHMARNAPSSTHESFAKEGGMP